MIVREMPNGQLLCIHQTTHALMAEQFCQAWGNHNFALPTPYSITMLAIAQHDNGWHEWEQAPRLRADGYPMDFIHDDDPFAKLHLWRRGVNRLNDQHPYAALLVGRHAALLYENALHLTMSQALQSQTREFIADQKMLVNAVRYYFGQDAVLMHALNDNCMDANTRLLQFGDNASLQVIMPWANQTTLLNCPVDANERTAITMQFDETEITFDPWPYAVDGFEVEIHGKLLSQRTFPNEAAYQTALAEAPYRRLVWRVGKS